MTEHDYAVAALKALQDAGWTLLRADNGEESIRPDSVLAAIKHVQACEMGSVTMAHGTYGRATFGLLFQAGVPEEVLYDYSYKTDESGAAIEAVLARVSEGLIA